MNQLTNITSFTASQARNDFYNLIKSAGQGLNTYEITLRDNNPVILLSKAEFESWMETIDILNSPVEMQNIKEAKKTDKMLTHEQIMANI